MRQCIIIFSFFWELSQVVYAQAPFRLPEGAAERRRENLSRFDTLNPKTVALDTNYVDVTTFFPAAFDSSGSTSYVWYIRQAISFAHSTGKNVYFPAISYLVDTTNGFKIYSNMTVYMYGARFVLSADANRMNHDGQVFIGYSDSNVTFMGGEIAVNATIGRIRQTLPA